MDAEIAIVKTPQLLALNPGGFWGAPAHAVMQEVQGLAQSELAGQTPGKMAETWHPTIQPLGDAIQLGFTNPHPGVRALDQGAQWPGRMPPWGPETDLGQWAQNHGIPGFLAARALQRNGLRARHFVSKSLEAVRYPARDLLMDGLRRWLQGDQ